MVYLQSFQPNGKNLEGIIHVQFMPFIGVEDSDLREVMMAMPGNNIKIAKKKVVDVIGRFRHYVFFQELHLPSFSIFLPK